jgi:UDP-N-acetyl-D-mannosaminuronate dehydrogenase
VLQRVPDLQAALADADVTILLQAHQEYDLAQMAASTPRMFDTRGKVPGDVVRL